MSSAPGLVLYDFNGVIADDEHVHQILLQKVMAEEGVTVTDADYHAIYLGFDDKGCFEYACKANHQPLDDARLKDLIARKSAYYDAYIEEHLVLFPGAVEGVRAMSAAYPMAIVSGALRGEIERICSLANISDCFGFIVAAEDTERCKPDPEGYTKALKIYNEGRDTPLAANHCVVIEDSIAGVRSAKAAGMQCVAVTHSYEADELTEADRVIEHMDEFTPELVASLIG
ncbi:MAG: HAD family hydrolase [Leptospirillia bacterium]